MPAGYQHNVWCADRGCWKAVSKQPPTVCCWAIGRVARAASHAPADGQRSTGVGKAMQGVEQARRRAKLTYRTHKGLQMVHCLRKPTKAQTIPQESAERGGCGLFDSLSLTTTTTPAVLGESLTPGRGRGKFCCLSIRLLTNSESSVSL